VGNDQLTDIAALVELLEAIAVDRGLLAEMPEELKIRLLTAAGKAALPALEDRKLLWRALRRKRQELRRQERAAHQRQLDKTGIRKQRLRLLYPTLQLESAIPSSAAKPQPEIPIELKETQPCYICRKHYQQVHSFYDSLCPACAEFNWKKRHQTADLSGRVAIVTGARVKIGYQAALMLLRAGAQVISVTRFPKDAVTRYAREPDFEQWASRLQVYGLDLRHTPSVELFAAHIKDAYDRLDFILNNACQTVRRPPDFYRHLIEAEISSTKTLPAPVQKMLTNHEALRSRGRAVAHRPVDALPDSAQLSQVPLLEGEGKRDNQLFPAGQLDSDLQQIDLRTINSWRLPLAAVSATELLEVHLVNAVAPFILNARLKSLMLRHPSRDKHIVNVSAMEGQFYRAAKTDKHPHTNMAKAALNMMTRTSAEDYIKDGIHMNSVDTGWITDEDPVELAERKRETHGFHPPLDYVDAAARICDPIFSGFITGQHGWGQFLKDYRPVQW
jgi:NAD(P)-dependent dehydrogenase (short-subunit alcohol dehydrogenase family)